MCSAWQWREHTEGHFNGAPGNTDLVSVFTILKISRVSFQMSRIMYIRYVWYAKWVESIIWLICGVQITYLRRPNNIFVVSK